MRPPLSRGAVMPGLPPPALFLLFFLLLGGPAARAQVSVLTQHNDNGRTGQNLGETTLTTANVTPSGFGRLFTRAVDAEIYAQPLYVPGVAVPGKGTHNVVYAATMNNTVYAFDADDPAQGAPLWSVNLGPPVPASDVQCCCPDISVRVGILSTPVIDPATGTLYVLSRNKNSDGSYHQWLNALDVTTGAARIARAEIKATAGPLAFDPKIQNQRPALTLANGNIYIAWASHNDCGPYRGWVMSYSASTLAQNGVHVNTPTGTQGGIWMAGQGLTVDAAGSVSYSGGNGSWAADGSNVGNSFVKLSPGLALQDWFTPYNSDSLNAGDQDLGSSGLLGVPGTPYLLSGGKQGVLYLVDTGNMTRFHAGADQVRQEFRAVFGTGSSHIHGGPIYYNSPANGPTVFVWGENDFLRAYAFNASTGLFNTTAINKSAMTAPVTNANGAMPGGFLALSSNGGKAGTGIVWASTPYNANANNSVVAGIVHAFDESTLKELWNSRLNPARDDVGNFAKNVPPTVANGKVYMASFGAAGSALGSGQLVVYGLLPAPNPDFSLSAAAGSVGVAQGASAGTSVTVTPANGFTGSVTLSASGLPSGVTAAFGTNPTTGSSTLTFTASATAATGTRTVTITGTSGSLSHTATLALTVSAASGGGGGATQALAPVADTYAQSGQSAAQNFGTSPQLIVKVNPPDLTRYTYLRFDLSKVTGKISGAKLRLYGGREGTNSSSSDSAYGVADTAWSETGLTWNNKPALGGKISTATVTSAQKYYEWDVTAYLQAQQAAGAKLVSLAVTMDSLPADGLRDNFNAREAAGSPPQLSVTTGAAVPSYAGGFAGASGLQLNGSAKISGSALRLTDGGTSEAASAFFATPVSVGSFQTGFSLQITGAAPTADGLTFCVQGAGPTALGGSGGGLGYGPDPAASGGASIPGSAAVKFDLYQNTSEGADSTGLFTGGASPTTPAADLSGAGLDLHAGHVLNVAVSYDGTTLTVKETDAATGAAATQSYPVNLASLVGGPTAYVGFTAGTGGLTATQDVLSWTFTSGLSSHRRVHR